MNSSNSFLLLRASDLGVSVVNVLLLYLLFTLVGSSLSYLSGVLSDRFGRRGILVMGYALYGLVYIGFAEVNSTSGLIVLFTVYGLYITFTKGVEKALVADLSGSAKKRHCPWILLDDYGHWSLSRFFANRLAMAGFRS
ncbi:MFS transporter [Paenibacillus sp. SC116]|nr:MFS transporter [Paenibacillus sp. SC116]